MAVKPRVVEYASEMDMVNEERVVDDAVLPVGRFVKQGTAVDTVTVCAQGEKAIGVSMESPGGRAAAYTSEWADYAIDDKASICVKTNRFVLIEAENQSITTSTVNFAAQITSSANGKAEVAASGDFILGRDASLVTYGGVVYIRFIPTWLSGEVV